ncbi:hypothetical protein DFH27DRAFT_484915 [Peziza echinospora]|nr:hypothetical protein DFH27DRAFT_484915 [Peziza echinospora]
MSSLTTSRPAIYSPKPQARPHGPPTPHPVSASATPLNMIHPPATPSLSASKQHHGAANSTGYFGLVVEPNDSTLSVNYARNNWSPSTSSIKSTAAKSPRPVAVEGLPEPFQKQAQALAFSLHQQNLSNPPDGYPARDPLRGNAMGAGGSFFGNSHLSSTTDNDHSTAENSNSSGESSYLRQTHLAGPMNIDPSRLSEHPHLRHTPLTFPPSGPTVPMLTLPKHLSRSATLPPSSANKGSDMIMVAPDVLARLLREEPQNIMLLDLRTYPQFSASRIQDAVHLCIPTTLLKRPSFNVAKLSETFANDADKAKFASWKEAKYIIVYDTESTTTRDAVAADHTINKFVREGWTGRAYCVKGGFIAFSNAFPERVDSTAIGGISSPKNLTLSGGSKIGGGVIPGGFNCQLPQQTSICNPFFSNIRQNMDLIGGVGEIAITIPPSLRSESRNTLPAWLRKITTDEGAKLVAEKFYKIEKEEQARMQKALNCSVTYDNNSQASTGMGKHTLAGVEKGQKNRYNNIWPYDHARVKLKEYPQDSCDYINASFINAAHSKRRYIATQGPLPSTFQDFWSVVWEQDVRVIVMLTAESEGGQLKCHQYWVDERYGPLVLTKRSEELVSLEKKEPKGVSKRRSTTGSATITPALHDSNVPHIIVRRFSLCHENYPFHPIREITQLQYSSWPDFGAPAHPAHILSLIEHTEAVVRSSRSQKMANLSSSSVTSPTGYSPPVSERPAIVHCSAGCGRTGTFCAVDTVISMMRKQQLYQQYGSSYPSNSAGSEAGSDGESYPDGHSGGDESEWMSRDDVDLISQVVRDFRDQRLSMVQSLRQFVLCYETVLEWISKQKAVDSGKRKA